VYERRQGNYEMPKNSEYLAKLQGWLCHQTIRLTSEGKRGRAGLLKEQLRRRKRWKGGEQVSLHECCEVDFGAEMKKRVTQEKQMAVQEVIPLVAAGGFSNVRVVCNG